METKHLGLVTSMSHPYGIIYMWLQAKFLYMYFTSLINPWRMLRLSVFFHLFKQLSVFTRRITLHNPDLLLIYEATYRNTCKLINFDNEKQGRIQCFKIISTASTYPKSWAMLKCMPKGLKT